jgi:hypothetical protein
MFEIGLSPTGAEPATHYISSGGVGEGFAALIPFAIWQWQTPELDETGGWFMVDYEPGDPFATLALCIEAGLEVTLEEIEDLYASSDVTDEPWQTALARMGLQLIRQPEPENG